jgi:hypothetical protein
MIEVTVQTGRKRTIEAHKVKGEQQRRVHEWHLDFTNSLEQAEFDLRLGSSQAVVPLGPPLGHAGLEPVGPIGDAAHGDGPEQLPLQCRSVARV